MTPDQHLMRTIGRAARQARRARKMTQEDAAARVGVSTQFYGRIERGDALPSVTTLRRMAEVLGVYADALLAGGVPAGRAAEPGDGPQLRRVVRSLRRTTPAVMAAVERILDALDEAIAATAKDGSDPRGA
jgi:transcriptional regulator with XRE-family HTH domain